VVRSCAARTRRSLEWGAAEADLVPSGRSTTLRTPSSYVSSEAASIPRVLMRSTRSSAWSAWRSRREARCR
jgi:hypothetical protein